MTYELALVSVVIGAGYWGVFFLRRRPHGTATFGLMQLGAAILAGLGLIGHDSEDPPRWLGVAGAVGVGAGACLLVLGPLVRVLARRLVAAERVGLANRLLDLADILAPGSGVVEEKALVKAMTEIRDGKIEPTVDALRAARARAPGEAQLAIDERLIMLYVAAYRWRDATAHAEAHLFAPDVAAAPQDGSLRAALGVAPPVWVELIGAYGKLGDLERAADLMARLEDVAVGRDEAAPWLHRARVMFLALAGRVDAVRALVGNARHMERAARSYWLAVAAEHAGDRAGAEAAYRKARSRARGRARALIDRALAELTPVPAALGPRARAVADRVAALPPPRVRIVRRRAIRTAWLLAALLAAISIVCTFAVGPTTETGTLLRIGAMVRSAVAAGEWWRLVSCVLVHAGTTHLIFNVAGLIVMGRFADDLFGRARMLAIFGGAGLAGSLASYLASSAAMSLGASGAVFGLLGAVFVELTLHRQHYQAAWKRGVWGGLAVVTLAQLVYDATNPVIDQWAHAAGLAAGAVLGLALSPHARWARITRWLARALAAACAGLAIVAAVLVVQTSIADTLARVPQAPRVVGGVAITAPTDWRSSGTQLVHPDDVVELRVLRQPADAPAVQLARWLVDQGQRAAGELGPLAPEPAIIPLPEGWEGKELAGAPEDALGALQPMRVVLCGKTFGDTVVTVAIVLPASVARATPGFFTRLLASIAPA